MNTVIQYMKEMAWGMLAGVPFVVGFRLFANFRRKSKGQRTTVTREILAALFGVILLGLFSQTILPELAAVLNGTASASGGGINLVLFLVFRQTAIEVFQYGHLSYFLINFLGNILIFIPLGFFPPLLRAGMAKFWKTALFGCGVSIFIELTQLLLPRGTDIDDVWLNTLGTMLGYLLFVLVRRAAPHFVTRCRVSPAAERK